MIGDDGRQTASPLPHSPSGPLAADRKNPNQMVPPTRTTCLDDICRVFLTPPVELRQFGVVSNDFAVRRKSRSEDVCDQNEIVLGTDRAYRFCPSSHAACRPHQFGVRIADVFAPEATASVFVDQRAARHPVIDETRTERRDGAPRSRSRRLTWGKHWTQVTPPSPTTHPGVCGSPSLRSVLPPA